MSEFVGGGMVGIADATIEPPEPIASVPKSKVRRKNKHSSVVANQVTEIAGDVLEVDSEEMVVAFKDITIGTLFMRQYKRYHYLCYLKKSETDFPPDFQVIILVRDQERIVKKVA